MLEIGKTYEDSKDSTDTRYVNILANLLKDGDYFNYAVFYVNPETKETEPGELSVHADSLKDFVEVKE
jgi:hypothetical protein